MSKRFAIFISAILSAVLVALLFTTNSFHSWWGIMWDGPSGCFCFGPVLFPLFLWAILFAFFMMVYKGYKELSLGK